VATVVQVFEAASSWRSMRYPLSPLTSRQLRMIESGRQDVNVSDETEVGRVITFETADGAERLVGSSAATR